jgi:hypothetical protein
MRPPIELIAAYNTPKYGECKKKTNPETKNTRGRGEKPGVEYSGHGLLRLWELSRLI